MSTHKKIYNALFTPSGCLTAESLWKYLDTATNDAENTIISQHLSECALCSDAVEGLKGVKDPDKSSIIIDGINEKLNFKYSGKSLKKRWISNQLLYMSVAASIVIMFGIIGYFKFFKFSETDKIATVTATKSKEQVPVSPATNDPDFQSSNKETSKSYEIIAPLETDKSKPNIADPAKNIERKIAGTENSESATGQVVVSENTMADHTLEKTIINKNTLSLKVAKGTDASPVYESQTIEIYLEEMIITAEQTAIADARAKQQTNSENKGIIGGIAAKALPDSQMSDAQTTRDKSGNRNETFENDMIKSTENQNSKPNHNAIEEPPLFPGGITALNDFMKRNFHYPSMAIAKRTQGTLYLSFIIEETGTVTSVNILQAIGDGCEEEALRVVNSMPEWLPGNKDGKPVRVRVNLPIRFQLQ